METHLTLHELAEKLAAYYDEISILEILNINSYDLVERFGDRIESRYERLIEEFQGEDTNNGEEQI
jgi:hypothetical protein